MLIYIKAIFTHIHTLILVTFTGRSSLSTDNHSASQLRKTSSISTARVGTTLVALPRSVKPHEDVTPNSSRKMHLSLQIKLDAHHQRRVLQLAVRPDGALEEVSYRPR